MDKKMKKSEEIMELKGCLASSDLETKDRVQQSAKKKLRQFSFTE